MKKPLKCANTVGLQNPIRANECFNKDGHLLMRPVPAENELRPPGADGTHIVYQGKASCVQDEVRLWHQYSCL